MKGKPGKTIRSGFGDIAAVPMINQELCTNCDLCFKVCKSFTIIPLHGKATVVPENGLGCIGCGQCMAVCPQGAVAVTGRRLTPQDAVPLPPQAERATPEALEGLLFARRSVREFGEQEVEKEEIERMLGMAASAPMGIPPSDVGVVVVQGKGRVQEFAQDIMGVFGTWRRFFNPVVFPLMRLFMKKADVEMMRDFVLPITKLMMDARKEGADYLFYHAPCVLLFHASPYADPVDGSIACTYAMLAAASLGLGTCIIGTVAYALERDQVLKEKWGIPPENKVAITMILGHPAFPYARGIRRSFASVSYR
jgi:nitroreductase/Pyruvate/2-oxoacid:ferredoxin oxidoreductase delta subunit